MLLFCGNYLELLQTHVLLSGNLLRKCFFDSFLVMLVCFVVRETLRFGKSQFYMSGQSREGSFVSLLPW